MKKILMLAMVIGFLAGGCPETKTQKQLEQDRQKIKETMKAIESGVKMEDVEVMREPLPPTDPEKRKEYFRQKKLEEAYARIDKLEGGTGRIYGRDSKQETTTLTGKAHTIAELMNNTLNKGYGYTCRARPISEQLVQCDLIWPSGTSDLVVLSLTKELANKSAEVRMASTIYVAGYIEGRRVCEWKYDMFTGDVARNK